MMGIAEILTRWNSGEGKPYKGVLIDYEAYEADPQNIGCMCAQGQVLHLLGGWEPDRLRDTDQQDADKATAKLLNISVTHSILLRSVNDKQDGAPSIVLTNPEKVIGDQAQTMLAFWLHLDRMGAKDWDAAWDAEWDAEWDAGWGGVWGGVWDVAKAAARDAARASAWDAAWAAAWDAAWDAEWDAGWDAARAAAGYACGEIQGARIMREKGQSFFFLPMFGFANPEAIPALPVDYGQVSAR